jgi:hypothetical protein
MASLEGATLNLKAARAGLLAKSARLACALLLVLTLAVGLLFWFRGDFDFASNNSLSNYFAYNQDLEIALLMLVLFLALALTRIRPTADIRAAASLVVPAAAALVFFITYAGTRVVFGSFDLSLDEVIGTVMA